MEPPLEFVGPCRECDGHGHVTKPVGFEAVGDLCRRCLGERIDINVAFDAPTSADA